ncbi:MAG: hypothetical protein AAF725_15715 [Acidobacteriota bacterium]
MTPNVPQALKPGVHLESLRAAARRRWPLILLAWIALLYQPTLGEGFRVDDHYHRAALTGALPGGAVPATRLFDFSYLEDERGQDLVRLGMLPWWSQEGVRLSFLRPIAGLTHGLDFRLWPERPALMHLHSVAWFAAAMLSAWLLFRRLLTARGAALASLIAAGAPGYALAVGWLANRNAVVALALGVAALGAHDAWRRLGSLPAALLAPPLLIAAVLANEGAVAAGAYLLAYAAFLDRSPGRWLALAPCALSGLAWAAAYRLAGAGIRGSGVYIDPLSDPLRFLAAAAERLPLLLWGQWAFPGPELHLLLAAPWDLAFVASGALLAPALGALLWPLRRDPASRFFAFGMALSWLPACATFPAGRLLFFSTLGFAGLLARLLERTFLEGARGWRRAGALTLAIVHLAVAPLSVRASLHLEGLGRLDGLITEAAASVQNARRAGPIEPGETWVLSGAPSSFLVAFLAVLGALEGAPPPDSVVLLSSGIYGGELTRTGLREIAARPAGGYLAGVREDPAGDNAPPLELRRALLLLDSLYRSAPFTLGERVSLRQAEVEVTALGPGGRALEATFRFRRSLEDPRYRWLCWRGGGFSPCRPPAVGETVRLAPPGTGRLE